MQRLPVQLGLDGCDDFRIAVADVEDAETAETVDVFLAVDVAVAVRSGVRPLDCGCGVFHRRGLAIFEEAGVDVVAEIRNRLLRDPIRLLGGNLAGFYKFEKMFRVSVYRFMTCLFKNFVSPLDVR